MSNVRNFTLVIVGGLLAVLTMPKLAIAAEPPTQRQLLAQYVIELRDSPENQALRERIIRLEMTLSPRTAVPVEAQRFFAKAAMFQKEANDIHTDADLTKSAHAFAISAYKEALLIAPWWAQAYYGLSASLEASGRSDEAVAALDLFIIAAPDAASAGAAEAKLCAILERLHP